MAPVIGKRWRSWHFAESVLRNVWRLTNINLLPPAIGGGGIFKNDGAGLDLSTSPKPIEVLPVKAGRALPVRGAREGPLFDVPGGAVLVKGF